MADEASKRPDEDKKRAAFQDLVDRVLNGGGKATPEQRAAAFGGTAAAGGTAAGDDGLPAPVGTLTGKVATRPAQVSDADFAAATAAGFSEDQIFELVVAAAVGQSARQYEAGLAALAKATGNESGGNEEAGSQVAGDQAAGNGEDR